MFYQIICRGLLKKKCGLLQGITCKDAYRYEEGGGGIKISPLGKMSKKIVNKTEK